MYDFNGILHNNDSYWKNAAKLFEENNGCSSRVQVKINFNMEYIENSHDLLLVPQDRVRMKICRRVKPKVYALLPATLPTRKDVGLQDVGLP